MFPLWVRVTGVCVVILLTVYPMALLCNTQQQLAIPIESGEQHEQISELDNKSHTTNDALIPDILLRYSPVALGLIVGHARKLGVSGGIAALIIGKLAHQIAEHDLKMAYRLVPQDRQYYYCSRFCIALLCMRLYHTLC